MVTIYTAVDETAIIKVTTFINGIMSEDENIDWGKKEEATLRSNEWNLIGTGSEIQ